MATRSTAKSDTRRKLVETADRLFYAEGIRAVGVDRIVAEAGVAKMSLYHHFASKDELLLAVLDYRERKVMDFFAEAMRRYAEAGADPLRAFFAALKEWFESSGFRGCAFINARAETPDPAHAAARFAAAHKERFHATIADAVRAVAGPETAARAAPAVALLVEGAIVAAVMEGSARPADTARDAALALLA